MIKQIGKHNLLTSPFAAVKAWELSNVDNEDAVLLEPLSQSLLIPDTLVAVDYIAYSPTCVPILNTDCNIALEQQDSDLAIFEEGVSGSGLFTPADEAQNDDGTYKRLVYDQMGRAFYNLYRNPLQIFGMENIDFPLSKTDRYLADRFLLFSIPRRMMGDRLVEGSIELFDNTLDDHVEIHDDGNQNLLAGSNLFSKIQEIRHIENEVVVPITSGPAGIPTITGSQGTTLSIENINSFGLDISVVGEYAIVVGFSGTVRTSTDGINWNSETSNASGRHLRGIAYNSSSLYVAVGQAGVCITSPDGMAWTAQSNTDVFPNWNMNSIVYNGTKFYAITDTGIVKSSTNGVAWAVESTLPSGVGAKQIIWDGTQFLVVNGNLADSLETSPDGITWTAQTTGTSNNLTDIVYAAGLYITVGDAGDILYSSDSITWNAAVTGPVVAGDSIASIVYGNGYWVLNTDHGELWYSVDGINWYLWPFWAEDGILRTFYYTRLEFLTSGDPLVPR